ncbi:MAG: uracil-DNA glycosylase [Gammaproteobacteria bacterium]|nr:uracil-DNA glycosylase [Gammaproteobacteria bacterium]
MTNLTSRQHEYLKAMGIDVWLPKDASPADVVEHVEPQPEVEVVSTSSVVEEAVPQPEIAPERITPFENDVSGLDWEALQTKVSQCQLCDLHSSRTQTVFGVGNQQADWLIIGEAPGVEEDHQGEPFVGQAGHLLTAMLQAIGLDRQQVYIANILKCHPPNNRDPKVEEATLCIPYLERQIELLQPKIILALGRIAAQRLLQSNSTLGRMRGKVHHIESSPAPVIVTYHPAYLLRSPLEKRKAWEDLLFAVNTVNSDADKEPAS